MEISAWRYPLLDVLNQGRPTPQKTRLPDFSSEVGTSTSQPVKNLFEAPIIFGVNSAMTRSIPGQQSHRTTSDGPTPLRYTCVVRDCPHISSDEQAWRDHDTKKHYQIEIWRCNEYSETGIKNQCGSIHYKRDQYHDHLLAEHGLNVPRDDERFSVNCVGRNGQSRFWCPCCATMVELETSGIAVFDERQTHILQHLRAGGEVLVRIP